MGNYLIVGLGNPGSKYEKTRHNLGFIVLKAFAKKHQMDLKRGWRISGKIAQGRIGDHIVHLLMPMTYMNLSGVAVHKALRSHHLKPSQMLVVVDDVYLKLGRMRLRPYGSAGGHNGLKSIDGALNTHEYSRLRMGVGPENEDLPNGHGLGLEDYVLSQFTADEQQALDYAVENSSLVIERWLFQGTEAASQLAGEINSRIK